jgi:hypothetical protein
VLLYGAGQAINNAAELDTDIRAQLTSLARVATNRYVAAMAQLNATAFPSVRYVLDPLGRLPVEEIADFDAGDPGVLVQFHAWADSMCAAEQTVLVLSGHGAAWEDNVARQALETRGLASQVAGPRMLHHPHFLFGRTARKDAARARALLVDGSNRDFVSNAELGAVLRQLAAMAGQPIGVVVLDACLMSSWEVLRELSGSVATVVASVDELSAAGIDVSEPVRVATVARGRMAPPELAASFVTGFRPRASSDTCVAVQLTGPGWDRATAAFRRFCDRALTWLGASAENAAALRAALRLAATSIVQFWSGGLADIGALATAVAGVAGLPSDGAQAMRDTLAAISDCVIGRTLGQDYAGAVGISVFSPGSSDVFHRNRADYGGLSFSRETGWDKVLSALYPDPAPPTA